MLKKDFYFLSPVEVVKVTTQNLQEVAEWCGGQVATTESRRVPGRQDSYVWVPTPKGTAISWAFPGMFITKRLVRTVKDDIRVTYAVFRRDYFEKNYFESPTAAVAQTWEKGMKTPNTPKKGPRPPKNLDIKVSVPEGSTPEDVREAVDVAVDVLQEQGMLPASGDSAVQPKADPEGILSNPAPTVPTVGAGGGSEGVVLSEDPGVKLVQDIVDKKDAADQAALEAIATSGGNLEQDPEIPDHTVNAVAPSADSMIGGRTMEEHKALAQEDVLPPAVQAQRDAANQAAQTASPKEIHNEQVDKVSPVIDEGRELVPDHELRVMGLPTSYQDGYKPVYRDEVPTDVTLS